MGVSAGAALIIVGVVWIAQGAGLLQTGSFMDGSKLWMLMGAVMIAVGVAMTLWKRRRPKG